MAAADTMPGFGSRWRLQLEAAKCARGVVLSTAQSLKCVQLKCAPASKAAARLLGRLMMPWLREARHRLLEKMAQLGDDQTRRKQQPATEHAVRALVATVQLFRGGLVVMDEIDLVSRMEREVGLEGGW